jgi:outer membrane cobalamin receptor
LILKSGMESLICEHTKIRVYFDEELSVITSNNYDQNASRNTATVTASAERNTTDRLNTLILIREIINNNNFLIPDFSAGLQLRISDAKEYYLKANISRNSKLPSMNDLFWIPGGNPELKNEYAFIYELSYKMKQKISTAITMSSDLALFTNRIKDMIQWHPGEYSFWTAGNIQSVNSGGIESSLAIDYICNNLKGRFSADYSYIRAFTTSPDDGKSVSVGKQLMYVPENQANASMRVFYKNIHSAWSSNFTGRRYITTDNTEYLPGYLLNDFMAGIGFNLKGSSLDVDLNVFNLFNVNYQSIAHFPLPGRSFTVKILVRIIK